MNFQQYVFVISIVVFILDLFLTASKTGMMNVRLPSLLSLREQENVKIDRTVELLSSPSRLRGNYLISQSFFRFLILGTAILWFVGFDQSDFQVLTFLLVILITAVILGIFELIVEISIINSPAIWSVRLTTFTRVIFFLLSPILIIPRLFVREQADEPPRSHNVIEDELLSLLDATEDEGGLEQDERQMIKSIFQLGDTFAREIMVPRIDMLALNVNTLIDDATEQMLESGYSRVPVYEESVDKVVGILYVKDLLRLCRSEDFSGTLHNITRPVYYVPETKKVDDLLTEMQEQRVHIAMVVDEYGGVAGLVTLEDIVEELVGEIQDEYDEAEEQVYSQISDNEYIFLGRIDLDDFNEIMETELPQDEADTLGGYIYSQIGRIPKGGETVHADKILLTVDQVTGRRIRKVKVKRVDINLLEGDYNNHANR